MKLKEKYIKRIVELINKYPDKKGAVIEALVIAQEQAGFVGSGAIEEISEILSVSQEQIIDALTFYSSFRTKSPGRFNIQICTGISCMLSGPENFSGLLKEKLEKKIKEKGNNNKITIEKINCCGNCDKAPVLKINGKVVNAADPDKLIELMENKL